ncbi:unnamed protein product, partial [Cladocopium goreaui]
RLPKLSTAWRSFGDHKLSSQDIRSEPLQMEKEYRFLAVLCQDPEARDSLACL